MNSGARLFWWILRTQLPAPVKITLFAMALHGSGLEEIRPGLRRVGHFRSRTQRMVREHVDALVSMGLLIPRGARTGGYKKPTNYDIGAGPLDRYADKSIDVPNAIVSPTLLKQILFADLKPHRKLLLWTIAMMGDQEFPQELLARALFRSTTESGLHQLRKDVAALAADGFITRTSSQGGAGRGIRCQVNVDALKAKALPMPASNPGYQLPPSAPLPFAETPGTDRTQTPGTDRTQTPGTHFLRSGTTIACGDFLRTGTDRKELSEVSGGEQRPVHAVENSAPPSPSPSHKPHRSTDWRRASSLGYELLRAAVSRHLQERAVDYGGFITNELRTELHEFAKSWCARHGVNRSATPAKRAASSPDISARVVDDVVYRYEEQHGRQKQAEGGTGAS